jgi:hypothetical protein
MRRSAAFALSTLGSASLAVALLTGVGSRSHAQTSEGAPRDTPPRVRPEARLVPQRQWEYSQMPCVPAAEATGGRRELEEKLNEQGKRGWELVSLLEVDHPPVRGCLLATFKRQMVN